MYMPSLQVAIALQQPVRTGPQSLPGRLTACPRTTPFIGISSRHLAPPTCSTPVFATSISLPSKGKAGIALPLPSPSLVSAHLTETERAAADKVESCVEDLVKASDSLCEKLIAFYFASGALVLAALFSKFLFNEGLVHDKYFRALFRTFLVGAFLNQSEKLIQARLTTG